jgi:hypothetical protein
MLNLSWTLGSAGKRLIDTELKKPAVCNSDLSESVGHMVAEAYGKAAIFHTHFVSRRHISGTLRPCKKRWSLAEILLFFADERYPLVEGKPDPLAEFPGLVQFHVREDVLPGSNADDKKGKWGQQSRITSRTSFPVFDEGSI